MSQAAPALEPALAALIDRCLEADPLLRPGTAEELCGALEALRDGHRPGPRPLPAPGGNPYRGLLPFHAEHRAAFFGRATEVRAVAERLRAGPLVLVAGDSGVGKSSLCRAGVLPTFAAGTADGEAEGPGGCAVLDMVPGDRPLQALAAALAPLLSRGETALREEIERDPALAHRELCRLPGRSALLFIDQLEELFSLSPPAEAARFAEVLAPFALRTARVRLLLCARGDYLTRLATLPGLGDEVARCLYILRPLPPQSAREVVVGPARQRGYRFASEAMVDQLVAAVAGPGTDGRALPLLQFALAELWEARDAVTRVIPAAALSAIGGVAGALARHADGVMAGMLPPVRRAARGVLLGLVTGAGTRARRTAGALLRLTEPHAAPEHIYAALEALVRGRLLVAHEEDGAASYELAHEALLQGWHTLREWLDEEAGLRQVRLRLQQAAAEWQRLGGAGEVLLRGRQLAEMAALDPAALPAPEARFLQLSRQQARARALLRRVVAAGLPALLVLAYAAVSLQAQHRRRQALRAAVARARAPWDEARGHGARYEEARRQALLLFDGPEAGARWQEAEQRWAAAQAERERADAAYRQAGRVLEAALTALGDDRGVRGQLGDITWERLLLAEASHQRAQRDELAQRLATLDPDGSRMRRLQAPAVLQVRTVPPGLGADLRLHRYVAEDDGRLRLLETAVAVPPAPGHADVQPGSYLLVARAPGRAPVRLPLLLGHGERLAVDLPLPPAVPPGYVYVPPGRFLFGSDEDEDVRRSFLEAPPLHEARTAGYLIGRTEVTFAEWLDFLRALPPAERQRHLPRATAAARGSLALVPLPGEDAFALRMQPATTLYTAREGAPLRYEGRTRRTEQDWLHLPASGLTWEDAQAYAAWLDRSGRLRGARLCDEREWERAARGADGRRYPHGDRLAPDDANFDATYGRDPRAFGPDEVGSHPASDSPFGVADLVGNDWEWVRSVRRPGEAVLRGGSWYHDELTCRSNNRQVGEAATLQYIMFGVRICADAE